MSRMRCSRRSGVIFLAMITAIAWPTPHHRLRRSLSSRRSLLVSASANYRHPPCLIITPNHRPRGSGQRSWTQGWRSQTEGEKQEANGGKLAFIRAVQAFTCHGAQNVSAAFQFYSTDFHVTTQPSLILSLYAPRYCLTASAGFGRQFTKLRALSRLRRRYGSKKESYPRIPVPRRFPLPRAHLIPTVRRNCPV